MEPKYDDCTEFIKESIETNPNSSMSLLKTTAVRMAPKSKLKRPEQPHFLLERFLHAAPEPKSKQWMRTKMRAKVTSALPVMPSIEL